jgi:hypothetical protein
MNAGEQWELAIEEFGDRAFERFGFALMGEGRGFSNPLCNSDVKFYECPLRSLPELYAHDVKFYGTVEKAILMWQWRYADGSNDWQDCNKELSFNPNKEYRRKTSAALPFDLDMAKAGNMVEYLVDDNLWRDCQFVENNGVVVHVKDTVNIYTRADNLRMKYPPKS